MQSACLGTADVPADRLFAEFRIVPCRGRCLRSRTVACRPWDFQDPGLTVHSHCGLKTFAVHMCRDFKPGTVSQHAIVPAFGHLQFWEGVLKSAVLDEVEFEAQVPSCDTLVADAKLWGRVRLSGWIWFSTTRALRLRKPEISFKELVHEMLPGWVRDQFHSS